MELTYRSKEDGNVPVKILYDHYVVNDCVYLALTPFGADTDEPYCTITRNLPDQPAPAGFGYLDIVNAPGVEEFITKNGFGAYTGINGTDGYYMYPLYRFDMFKIRTIAEEQKNKPFTPKKEEKKMGNYNVKADLMLRDDDSNIVAAGPVIINNQFKVWANVMTNKDGEEFVSFPRRQTNNEEKPFEDVFYLADKDLREFVTSSVLNQTAELKELAAREPDVSVRVTPYNKPDSNMRAIVTAKVDGVGIKGIRILESEKGNLYVRPPQYMDKNENYHDQVSIIDSKTMKAISEECIKQYEAKKDMTRQAPDATR